MKFIIPNTMLFRLLHYHRKTIFNMFNSALSGFFVSAWERLKVGCVNPEACWAPLIATRLGRQYSKVLYWDLFIHLRLCGLMDKAPDFGSGDCRFESCHDRYFLALDIPTLCFNHSVTEQCLSLSECISFNTTTVRKDKHI